MFCVENIFSFIFILLLLSQSYSKPLCLSNLDCHTCQHCGFESEDYSTCFYRNMFCKNDSKIIYSLYLKREYTFFFDNNPELDDFCGEVEYELENVNDTIILFTSKNKTFPKESPIRCHYLINSINNNSNNPYLQINLKNSSKNNETKNISDFKADIGAIFTLTDSNIEEVEAINVSELIDKYYINTLKSAKRLEIFLDFEPKKENQNDVLEIKLNFGKMFDNITKGYYNTYSVNISASYSDDSDSCSSAIIGIIIGLVSASLILFIIIYCCCCKSETKYVEVYAQNIGMKMYST